MNQLSILVDLMWWSLAGFVAGVIGRTLFDWWAKIVEQGGDVHFDYKYLATMLLSLVTALAAAMALFPTLVFPATDNPIIAFITAFSIAFAINHGINTFEGVIEKYVKNLNKGTVNEP